MAVLLTTHNRDDLAHCDARIDLPDNDTDVVGLASEFADTVAQAQLSDLKRYMARGALRVEARPPTAAGPPSVGRLAFLDNTVDQSTGTIAVRATFQQMIEQSMRPPAISRSSATHFPPCLEKSNAD